MFIITSCLHMMNYMHACLQIGQRAPSPPHAVDPSKQPSPGSLRVQALACAAQAAAQQQRPLRQQLQLQLRQGAAPRPLASQTCSS